MVSQELVNRIERASTDVLVRHESIFAPIPTLTETSKLAVATGRASPSGANAEAALKNAYADKLKDGEIQFERSWGDFVEPVLSDSTRLFVYFENHIDDLLHDCSDPATFRRQLTIILEKVERLIASLFSQAAEANKRITAIVTADHGFALLQSEVIASESTGDGVVLRDRCTKLGVRGSLPNGFAQVRADGIQGAPEFVVRLDRARFRANAGVVVHGGLTPEEVLIPFIQVVDASVAPGELLSISCPTLTASRVFGGWEIRLVIRANAVTLRHVEITFGDPFIGHGGFGDLTPEISEEVAIVLRSSVEQSGITTVPVRATYLTSAGRVEETKADVKISLPPLLLKTTEQTTAFDQMFE
jgi:hypothetical protein